MIEFCNVFKKFKNDYVINDLSFTVSKGESVYIYSPKPSGKSTVFSLIALQFKPDYGKIFIDNKNILLFDKKNIALHRKKLGLVFQSNGLISNKTVIENIYYQLKLRKILNKNNKLFADKLLYDFDLQDKLNSYPNELSYSEYKLTEFCKSFVYKPNILLLDDIYSFIDLKYIYKIQKYYRKEKKMTVIIFLNNYMYLKNTKSKIFYLSEKGTVEKITQGYFENIDDNL